MMNSGRTSISGKKFGIVKDPFGNGYALWIAIESKLPKEKEI